jgi:DNA-binding transcriptional regulator YdaS (Cro superfamily)
MLRKNPLVDRLLEASGLGPKALAKQLRMSRQALHKWRASYIPADRALEVERLSGGKVTRDEVLHQVREWQLDKERDRTLRREAMMARLRIRARA